MILQAATQAATDAARVQTSIATLDAVGHALLILGTGFIVLGLGIALLWIVLRMIYRGDREKPADVYRGLPHIDPRNDLTADEFRALGVPAKTRDEIAYGIDGARRVREARARRRSEPPAS